jgi:hypothetical protein
MVNNTNAYMIRSFPEASVFHYQTKPRKFDVEENAFFL